MGKEEEEKLRKAEAEKRAAEEEEKRKASGKGGKQVGGGGSNVKDARKEMTKTKEQLEEERESPCPSRSNLWMSMPWTLMNCKPKLRNCGKPLSGLKQKNMILRSDRRDRTMTSKSSRRDKNNN